MTYWRMQLHPNASSQAMRYAVESLASGFIGLDFGRDPGDLRKVKRAALPTAEQDYWDFANSMAKSDKVLVIVHHYPFALATIDGDYNYITEPVSKLGVWFRHFRPVVDVQYYADRVTNVTEWDQFTMTDTISILKDPKSKSYLLIDEW